jgi:hypothetical protein
MSIQQLHSIPIPCHYIFTQIFYSEVGLCRVAPDFHWIDVATAGADALVTETGSATKVSGFMLGTGRF